MFQFEKEYILRNQIVELIPLDADHFLPLFKTSFDKSIWAFFLEEGYGEENFRKYFANALSKREEKLEYPFAIKDLRQNAFAGMTRIYDVSTILKNAKIGHTWIGTRYQGTGLNKNSKYLLFEFLFDHMDFKRIGFGANSKNQRSINAMKSVGCKEEGVLRSYIPATNGGERVDVALLSILFDEWDSKVRRELKEKVNPGSKSS